MKNYISAVLSRINNKNYGKAIEAELQGHLQDRIDYYVNAGCDPETAVKKANEHMGETAELVGDQLNSMKKSKLTIFLTIILILLSTVFIVELCGYTIFSRESILSSRLGLSMSSVCLLLAFINLFVAVVIKKNILALSASFMFLLHGIASCGFVPVVFYFCELVKGKRKYFSDFFHLFIWKCDNVFINAFCILFIVACFMFSICVFFHIYKFNKLKNGKNFYRNEKCLKIIVIVFMAFITFINVMVIYYQPAYQNDFSKQETYVGLYILESDEKVNPQNIKYHTNYIRFYSYDYCQASNIFIDGIDYSDEELYDEYREEPYTYYTSCNTEYKKYDDWSGDVLYLTGNISAEFKTDKKYVMILPMLSKEDAEEIYGSIELPDYSQGEWLEVSKGITVKTGDREYKYNRAILEYELTIIPK